MRKSPIGMIAAAVALAGLVAWIVVPNFGALYARSCSIGVSEEMRDFAVWLASDSSSMKKSGVGRDLYWGPLTPELLESARLSPDRFVDPCNRSAPRSEWRTNPTRIADSPSWTRLRGGDFQLYCDGDGFWMIIGRGPDETLNLSREAIDANLAALKKNPDDTSILSSYRYDLSNGTVSSGDIWRIPD